MRAQRVPAALTWPVTVVSCWARSLLRRIWHNTPFHTPRPTPTWTVLFGRTLRSVAVTVPVAVTVKVKTAAPFGVRVPAKVSVTVGAGSVGVGVVVVSPSSHPLAPRARASTRASDPLIDLRIDAP